MLPFLLLADSNIAVLRLHSKFFTDQGYEVQTVFDVPACLQHLHQQCPDVLILDRNLLWGGAEGVLERMKEAANLPAVPVVITSTSAYRDDEFASAPVVARLVKPFRLAALAEAVAGAAARPKVCQQR
jgi:CheY-like chemotaxis protein